METSEVQFGDNYAPAYNKAKRYLVRLKQHIRELAASTVSEVRDLKIILKDPDVDEDAILKLSLDKMTNLIIKTLKTSKEALENYNAALETFENLIIGIEKQNRKLEKMVTKDSAEYKAWTQRTRAGLYGFNGIITTSCIIADIFGYFGLCSTVNAITISVSDNAIGIEVQIAQHADKLEMLKSITDRMLVTGSGFETSIHEAIGVLTDEIELITNWRNSTEFMNRNFDNYPKEYLKKYIVNGLNYLQNSADNFLAQPGDILA